MEFYKFFFYNVNKLNVMFDKRKQKISKKKKKKKIKKNKKFVHK